MKTLAQLTKQLNEVADQLLDLAVRWSAEDSAPSMTETPYGRIVVISSGTNFSIRTVAGHEIFNGPRSTARTFIAQELLLLHAPDNISTTVVMR